LEDRIKSGAFTVNAVTPVVESTEQPIVEPVEEPEDEPDGSEQELTPAMWADICMQMRSQLKPPVSGFFAPNGPVKGIVKGNVVVLSCENTFTKEVVDKPEVLQMVAQKVSAALGRPVRAVAANKKDIRNKNLENLLQFGRDHADVINIKQD
jgi:hypothetical protein